MPDQNLTSNSAPKMCDDAKSEQFKEEGNNSFKEGKWEDAIKLYTDAIKFAEADSRNLSVYYKNRAAAHLKQQDYDAALEDCDKSLKIVPTDPKALFRRCQALEALKRYEEAYRDATQIFKDDPTNKPIQPVLARLHNVVQERARQNAQTSNKLESMMKIGFDLAESMEKRETAMNNLLVLSRDNSGAQLMMKSTVVQQIKKLLKVEKNREIFLTGIRIIGELCKHNEDRTKMILKEVGVPWFLELLDSTDAKQVNAAEHCMQSILNALSGMENKPDTKPKQELIDKNQKQIDTLLTSLVCSINNRVISGLARDAIIELLMRNIHHNQLNWAQQLVDAGGVERLLECASELEEHKYESAMSITPSTGTVAAVCLARVHENMYHDALKEQFMGRVDGFMRDKLLTPGVESKVRATVALTALLRGPSDVGNAILAREGVVEMVLVMANTEDELQQRAACECLVAAASRADKARAIVAQGVATLKRLYKQGGSEGVRIRALVGLCKLGSSGGSDASVRPFAEGSTIKLAEACRRFLLQPDGSDGDLRRWAAEGLSYLTLDAEVKEKLIEDQAALRALTELAQTGDQSALFGVVTTLVNLCNAYERQEVIPEMVQLAQFAKQHVPEEHELDDADFVTKRVLALGRAGVAAALVTLSRTGSDHSRELIARVFNALCGQHELRGVVVAQGGVKALAGMALKGTDKGKRQAAQALSRIGITINPSVAFPGQRALEIIRPLVANLHPDCTGLENFEAMMALCNLAQLNEAARQRILADGGFAKIEHYMFEDHEQLCRAAAQCVCNMAQSEDVVRLFEGDNDRVKMAVALCLDADVETAVAASGTLAILTGVSKVCCEKVFDSKNWLDCLHRLLADPEETLQFRGVCVAGNIVAASKELTERLMETDVLEILMALSRLPADVGANNRVVEAAGGALRDAERWGVIKRPGEGDD